MVENTTEIFSSINQKPVGKSVWFQSFDFLAAKYGPKIAVFLQLYQVTKVKFEISHFG